ncbi:MAG: DJ-1/PfpI family protein [Nitrospira sp.]|nr:DJ-1/PfpI family protein [Nitrospira sp.]MBH0183267.1 DJ-1/PfpI family protein [Nitrospira sp.]MBH0186924.1 DJ-1/PfpI family protein [Nitrospira sp.]MBH0189773.1 DJ-1/PfpI family protein [Nitrospira sp.]
MQLAILLYDGVTALDAIGPYEVLQAPGLGIDVRFVAREKGMKRTDFGRLGLQADYTLDEVPRPDILLVPGTAFPQAVMGDPLVLEWIAQVHQTTKWTTSVCTGALGLAAAGVLQGLKATTHWLAHDVLKQFGALPTKERVVRDGKVVTAAGVSSGIDMALTLVAEEFGSDAARLTQLLIEYDPHPPFDAGSPDKAPPLIVSAARDAFQKLKQKSAV